MRDDDVVAANELAVLAFEDLARRLHEPPYPGPGDSAAHVRLRHLLGTDPGGAWVAESPDGSLAGVALALLREGLWGLSLLVVRPGLQSSGVGSALLQRTLAYGAGARGWVILASSDPRALRAYARSGLALHPALAATGRPASVAPAPEVRPWEPGDHALARAVDHALRGAAHGPDLDALALSGCELLTLPGRGYVAHRAGAVKTLAALDDEAAAALLRAVLVRLPEGAEAGVEWITSAQQWAIDVAVEARLELQPAGAVCLRGETGRFRPYLPGGSYL